MTSGRGVVSAGDAQTARAGASLLEQGGSAVDAAVAAAFAAFVCELPLCSPLGGGALVVEEASGDAHALDLFARTPGLGLDRDPHDRATLDFYALDVGFGATTQTFHVGRGSVAVPLALPGLLEAHGRWGRLPLAEVLAPAVALARDGYRLGPGVARIFEALTPIASISPECRALHFGDGEAIAAEGARLHNRDLAAAMLELARSPSYVRDLHAAFAREFGPASGGLVTPADLEAARVAWRAPVRVRRGDVTLATMPAPSTGGTLVALGLLLHEGDGALAYLSPEHLLSVGRVQEVLLDERGRARLDPAYVDELRARLRERADGAVSGARPAPDSPLGSTTQISAIDASGLAVALTLTNGEGSGHVLRGTGMIANNLLGEEDIHPRGFHVDAPGTSLMTMMAPSILRSATSRVALGSGGSNRLRNAILQALVAVVEHGASLEEAVSAPRLQLDARADGSLRAAFEREGMSEAGARALRAAYPREPAIFERRSFYFGGVHAAAVTKEPGAPARFHGAGDPRRGGAVVVV